MREPDGVLLKGIDGANPLGFLAALGVLRLLTLRSSESTIRMKWVQSTGAWRPVVVGTCCLTPARVLARVWKQLLKNPFRGPAGFDKNVKMLPDKFRQAIISAPDHEYGACLASDALLDQKGNVAKSRLQMVNGGKRQDYLPIIENVEKQCTTQHVHKCMFEEWRYSDPMAVLSLRWDPRDDRRHAYRWDDPSEASTRQKGCELGASRLAIEALPMFPVCCSGRRARTVGFAADGDRFRWPIWIYPATLVVVQSLLNSADLYSEDRKSAAALRALGIGQVYSSVRFPVDKYQTASFSISEVWR